MQAAQNSAQIFIGLNLKCNSCHDSFISKWTLKDAYGLASFFGEDERLRLYRCDVAQDDYATPAFLFPELNRVPPSASLPTGDARLPPSSPIRATAACPGRWSIGCGTACWGAASSKTQTTWMACRGVPHCSIGSRATSWMEGTI